MSNPSTNDRATLGVSLEHRIFDAALLIQAAIQLPHAERVEKTEEALRGLSRTVRHDGYRLPLRVSRDLIALIYPDLPCDIPPLNVPQNVTIKRLAFVLFG